ncbi:hypothetical protein TNCV_2258201 [Trichonephila clavipes]|nr:hypothetical protein TNCV_2258201 [Trichonephila clavipes]
MCRIPFENPSTSSRCCLGFYLLPAPVTSADYRIFSQELLPSLLDPMVQRSRRHMWFQHDGEPPHYGRCIFEHLNQVFGHLWISYGGQVP